MSATTLPQGELPAPQRTAVSEAYWQALQEGRLIYQRCLSCGHAWLPPRSECPRCLLPEAEWREASGQGRLVSWVVYHHAYHPYFATRLPYNVAVVELAEGPRLVTNIVGSQRSLAIDMPVALVIEQEAGVALPRFAPA
jgi:uncharacterized OB-fold protein